MMRASKQEIKKVLNSAEVKNSLKQNTLLRIYEAEARVVFMRRRSSILKDIRAIIVDSSKKGE